MLTDEGFQLQEKAQDAEYILMQPETLVGFTGF